MKPGCSECGARVSAQWYILSFNWSQYICPQCGTVLRWTARRWWIDIILGMGTAVLVLLSEVKLNSVVPGAALGLLLWIVSIATIPGQYKIAHYAANKTDNGK